MPASVTDQVRERLAGVDVGELPTNALAFKLSDVEGVAAIASLAITCGVPPTKEDVEQALVALVGHLDQLTEDTDGAEDADIDTVTLGDAESFFRSYAARLASARGEKTHDGVDPRLRDMAGRIFGSSGTGSPTPRHE